MGKFVIECPDCGSYVEIGTGLFAKKTVKCSCGRTINAKDDMLSSKVCPHCGNNVMYDQRKGEKATCPVCHQKINTVADKFALVDLKCPTCASTQKVNKKVDKHTCSVCGEVFDVKKLLAQDELKKSESTSIIKWDGSEDLLIFKHPIEEFNKGSQVIVKQGQEALFVCDGVITETYGAGRHELKDGNGAEIYFINKLTLTNVRWGTPSKVRIMEQTYNFPVEIGARGSFNLEINNAKVLLARLIGNVKSYVITATEDGEGYGIEYVRDKFADMIAQNVTSMLARIITENKINLLTIDTMKPDIARLLGNVINNALSEFGLQIPTGQFYVTDIVTPDDDPNYIRLKNQYASSLDLKDAEIALTLTQAEAKVRMAEAQVESDITKLSTQGIVDSVIIGAKGEAEKITIEGNALVDVYRSQAMAEVDALKAKGGDYKLETERIVNSTIAENGVTLVNVNIENADKWTCTACGKTGITSNFCPDCGAKKLATPTAWDCVCGKKGITSNFCPDCGAKKA